MNGGVKYRLMTERGFNIIAVIILIALLMGLLLIVGCPKRLSPVLSIKQDKQDNVPIIRVLVAQGKKLDLSTTGGYKVISSTGQTLLSSYQSLPRITLMRQENQWSLGTQKYIFPELSIVSEPNSFICIGKNCYRGKMVFYPDDDGGILAINHINLETYISSVLAGELYSSWSPVTYQAQAIAARTYALYEMGTFGRAHRYDLRADQSSQVYRGVRVETEKSHFAAEATRGIVLAYGPEGREKIFKAYYSACCGGMVNSVEVLTGKKVSSGPLAGGQICNDCRKCKLYRWQAVSIPKYVIYRALVRDFPQVATIGGIKTIKVIEVFKGSKNLPARPVQVSIVGTNGKKVKMLAETLRLTLLRFNDPRTKRLYSMNCQIRDEGDNIVFENGRGLGHGVGLCQWGAEGKARRGWSVKEILSAYYPGAKLFRVY
ncbi:MAG: hypothetical protein DRN88_05025 [Candidatus Hydrothermarchaeota archaeon]|nr:MAG: hypothetical protein DRN88_05025 [Candidatus Hydrothermarchaeota archaeon]